MPQKRWLQLLAAFSQYYEKDSAKLVEQADQIAHGLKQMEFTEKATISDTLQLALFDTLFQNWEPTMDMKDGGRLGAPKFPMPDNYHFLMQYYLLSENKKALDFTKISLDKMGNGGIYDQIAGGFSRYSVDAKWLVPHFEKMLYDQAQIALNALEMKQASGDERYAWMARDIFGYVTEQLTGPHGGFYSAEDADSTVPGATDGEHAEGAFYVWAHDELAAVLGKDMEFFSAHFGVKPEGNVPAQLDPQGEFTGKNVLRQVRPLA
jgi:uncharacterized protein YyaL (SSP411 family)